MDSTDNLKGAHVVLYRTMKTARDVVRGILLCKRTLDAPIHAGYWSLFGGELKEKESAKVAAMREVEEELGIKLKEADLESLCDVKVARGQTILTLGYFHCMLDLNLNGLTLQPHLPDGKVEGEGLGWFSAEEVHHLMVRPEDRIAVNTFFTSGT